MNFYNLFLKPYEAYTPTQIMLEVTAVLFGLLSVYFSIRKKIWVYPTGIVSTALYVYILFVFGLLGDCMINIYYTIMSVYGWVLWSKSSADHVHVKVSWATKKEWNISGILFILSFLLVSTVYHYKALINNRFVLTEKVQAQLGLNHLDWANWLDILVTSVFLIGMWLMAKRRIDNWVFWIVGDLISIPMYLYKGLGLTSLQYLIFTVMAVYGFREWRRSLQTDK